MPENDFTRFRDMIARSMPPSQVQPAAPPAFSPGPPFAAPQPPTAFPTPSPSGPPDGFDVLTTRALPHFPLVPQQQTAPDPGFMPPPFVSRFGPQRFDANGLNGAGLADDLVYRRGNMNGMDRQSMVALVANKTNPAPLPATTAQPPATPAQILAVKPSANYQGMDWNKTLATLDEQASKNSSSTGWCGKYVREALEAGGFIFQGDHKKAAQFGEVLKAGGARPVLSSTGPGMPKDYVPREGDIAVFEANADHPDGHVQMFDGHRWVSDWQQRGAYSPFKKPETTPNSVIYRISDD